MPEFVKQHARQPEELTCYIPVEHLSVASDTEVVGLRLLPPSADEVPKPGIGFYRLDPPVRSVASVPVTGTDRERMAERAALIATHGLRTLRVALREHRDIHDRQLRFRVARSYAFADGISGWRESADAAYELTLSDDLVALASSQSVARAPVAPRNRLERKADVALRWMERASFATEPITALLYLFFALEALLGDKAEKLKGPPLAFRRAMLGEAVGAGFVDPGRAAFLYDVVRSAAVHGETVPEVRWDLVQRFAWDVRQALNQYLDYAEQNGITRQSRLVQALDQHPDRPQLVAWLRENGGPGWSAFLGTEPSDSDSPTEAPAVPLDPESPA